MNFDPPGPERGDPMNSRSARALTRKFWRLIRSLNRADLPPVYLASVPKAGTHLMAAALEGLGFRLGLHQPFASPNPLIGYDPECLRDHASELYRGEYILEHLTWSPEAEKILAEAGLKIVFIYRDPRAVVASYAHFGPHMNESHPLYDYFSALPDLRSRIEAALAGISGEQARDGVGRAAWGEILDRFAPWRESPNVCAASFEELAGREGGGDDALQLNALTQIATHLDLEQPEKKANEAARRVFNKNSMTFRAGRIDGWRQELDSQTIELIEEKLGDRITQWGYEL